jgi:hypothetical protein
MRAVLDPPRADFTGESDRMWTCRLWKPKWEMAAKNRPKGALKGTVSSGYASPRGNPSDETLTQPCLKGERDTQVLKFKAMLRVTGSMRWSGSARALMSHVPPESMRQGAEASMACGWRIFFTDSTREILLFEAQDQILKLAQIMHYVILIVIKNLERSQENHSRN